MSGISSAQIKNSYSYQQLSQFYYSKQSDSIKKAWVCPVIYKDKNTQKKYKEMWDERTSFITSAIDNGNFIHDDIIYNYIEQIIDDIAKGNPGLLPKKPLLLIDRSSSVNAYSIGGNIIAVNLGLIVFANSREEIALVIAHELSHDILNHVNNAIKERAEWLSSDEYKNSLNSVLDSKYGRLTRLRKILESYSFSRSKHNRYHESDADSLAVILLKNSNIPFDPKVFLRLDSVDIQYKQPLNNSLKDYFTQYNLPFEDAWTQKRSKGLSTRAYNFKDTTGIEDSLKTHPDCIERYNKTKGLSTFTGAYTTIPKEVKDRSLKMLLWNMFNNQDLTQCLYRILIEKDKGNKDEWFDFMIYNVFSGLYYADKQMNRFNAIGVIPKEFISKNYYELQNMLEQMPDDQLEQYCKVLSNASFWQKTPADAKGMKELMTTIDFDPSTSSKTTTAAAKGFIENYPTSIYCEFADHFKKK